MLPALADIFAFLRNSQKDMLIKIPLVHYQFEMLHPYEKYNSIIGRIKFFVNAINEATKLSAQLLMQYEDVISSDEKKLSGITPLPKSVSVIYDCLKKYPIINVPVAEKLSSLSFNTVSKALLILEKNGTVKQCGNNGRNRIFKNTDLNHLLVDTR